jgi:hypothetical protein
VKCLAFFPCVFDNSTNILKNGRKMGKCHQGSKLIIFTSLFDYLEFLSKDLDINQLYLIQDHFFKKSQELARPVNKVCRNKSLDNVQKIEISLSKRIKHIARNQQEEGPINETFTPFKRNLNVSFIVYSVLTSFVISIGLVILAYFNVKLNRFLFVIRNNN